MSNEALETENSEEVNNETIEITPEMAQAYAESRADDPTEIAATMHNLYLPMFCNAVDKLSSASLKRILKYLVSYPLVDCEISKDVQGEGQVAYLGNNLVECKFVMIMDTYNNNVDKLTASTETEEIKEENNG